MKLNLFVLFLAALLMMVFIEPQAQNTTVKQERGDNSVLLSFSTNVDSLTTVTSKWFSIADLLSHSLYTYPISYTKIQSSVLDKPHITTTIEGSNDQVNVAVVDTIGTVGDSLETLYSGTIDLNNKKFWYYRIKHTGTGTGVFANKRDAIIRTDLIPIRPKN